MVKNIEQDLLSNSGEIFQSVKIGDSTVILSIKDDLKLGHLQGSDFENFRDDENPNVRLYLFAEHVSIGGDFEFNGGIISAHEIISSANDTSSIISSGSKGEHPEAPNVDTKKDGIKGGKGGNAGEIKIYAESIPNVTKLKLIAKGGDGGAGQVGTVDSLAGAGGDAGNGGEIIYVYTDKFLKLIPGLDVISHYSTKSLKKKNLENFLEKIKTDEKFADVTSALQTSIDQLNKYSDLNKANQYINQAIDALKAQSEVLSIDIQDFTIQNQKGTHGVGGVGKKDTGNGADGKDGVTTTVPVCSSINLDRLSKTPIFFAHPSELSMLLEKAKLLYFNLDGTDKEALDNTYALFNRIRNRTVLFKGLSKESALYKEYTEKEYGLGVSNSIAQLVSIYDVASSYIFQLTHGQDFFGYIYDYVPLVSYSEYETLLQTLLDNFKDLEKNYNQYYQELRDKKNNVDYIKSARSQISSIQYNATLDLGVLEKDINTEAQNIDFYQSTLEQKKQDILNGMDDLKSALASHFDFNIDSFFSSLSMIAFDPSSKAMLFVESTKQVYDSFNKVTNDEGIQVNKDYIIRNLTQVESDFKSLVEGYSQNQNGEVKAFDLNGNMLFAEKNSFFKMMDQFYNQFPSKLQHVKLAFDRYVSAVTNRNNSIMNYNAKLALILKKKYAIEQAKQTAVSINNKAIDNLLVDSNLSGLFGYVSHIYYSFRFNVMEVLNLTERAFRFWSLNDLTSIKDQFASDNLSSVNYEFLNNIKNNLLREYILAEENFGSNAQPFPADFNDKSQQGIIVTLDEYTVASLKLSNKFEFEIPPVYSNTNINQSPFAGKANIRLTGIRLLIMGAKTSDNNLTVSIKHTGEEVIIDQQSKNFSFKHKPKLLNFEYDTRKKLNEIDRGTLGWAIDSSSTKTYSLIGPFAKWQVEVKDNLNRDLDLSDVKEIIVEFSGTSYPF